MTNYYPVALDKENGRLLGLGASCLLLGTGFFGYATVIEAWMMKYGRGLAWSGPAVTRFEKFSQTNNWQNAIYHKSVV